MGTPFSEIYDLFLSKIDTYELASLDETTLEENMQLWLMGAIPHFQLCKKNLEDMDIDLSQFNVELNISEKAILSLYMIHEYTFTFLMREENLSQALNSKDYRMYSPQGQMKAIQGILDKIIVDANALKSKYSWNIHSIRELFKK